MKKAGDRLKKIMCLTESLKKSKQTFPKKNNKYFGGSDVTNLSVVHKHFMRTYNENTLVKA